ncbi:alpha/beta fold hydrolase [Halovenus sp. WSH3]|uniref:Alpha/beta fold hydrolase n=1 Tax=Halovenus carboxidivorans TaxID=2692199 RepID=A0A6B0T334_9EURY|nr:alpha/beta hydrolase [Halovenus carboxidivorans]MXR52445.1 alpha/beta fold hydrolase [Halovenus carboxidivorans]
MPTVQRDGVQLYYEYDDGATDAPPVVFVQGLGVGRWSWHWQHRAFEAYDLIFPDNRGTGDSEAGLPPLVGRLPQSLRVLLFTKLLGYSTEGLAADLDAVLADAGVEQVHVVGASLGGMIAQQYALDHDRAISLSLLCTTHGGEEAIPIPDETLEQMFDVPEGADERETIRHRMDPAINDEFAERNPEVIEQIIDWRIEQDAGEVARESQGAAGVNFDASDRVHEIDLPTLILHGTHDRVLPVKNGELLAEKIPDSRFERIDGGSHLFMIEDSEEVNGHLRELFESV